MGLPELSTPDWVKLTVSGTGPLVRLAVKATIGPDTVMDGADSEIRTPLLLVASRLGEKVPGRV